MGDAVRVGGVRGTDGDGVYQGAQGLVRAGALGGDRAPHGVAHGPRHGLGSAPGQRPGAVAGTGSERVQDGVEQRAQRARTRGAAREGRQGRFGVGNGHRHGCALQ